ncbi:hypothetical protein BBJ28_00005128, partial [Nothophytophthora sp. Chile5]
ARLPVAILKCSAVSREINFSSAEEIPQFRLEQRIFLESSCIEASLLIELSARPVRSRKSTLVFLCRLVGHLRSGKLTIETAFYDGQVSIAKTVYRIYYD